VTGDSLIALIQSLLKSLLRIFKISNYLAK